MSHKNKTSNPKPTRYYKNDFPWDFSHLKIGDWIEGIGDISCYSDWAFVKKISKQFTDEYQKKESYKTTHLQKIAEEENTEVVHSSISFCIINGKKYFGLFEPKKIRISGDVLIMNELNELNELKENDTFTLGPEGLSLASPNLSEQKR